MAEVKAAEDKLAEKMKEIGEVKAAEAKLAQKMKEIAWRNSAGAFSV